MRYINKRCLKSYLKNILKLPTYISKIILKDIYSYKLGSFASMMNFIGNYFENRRRIRTVRRMIKKVEVYPGSHAHYRMLKRETTGHDIEYKQMDTRRPIKSISLAVGGKDGEDLDFLEKLFYEGLEAVVDSPSIQGIEVARGIPVRKKSFVPKAPVEIVEMEMFVER